MEDPACGFDRAVFAGSPLSRDWSDLHLHRASFERLQNEVQEKDWVAALSPILHYLVDRRFGNAGLTGFAEVGDFVHSVNSPHELCTMCKTSDSIAPIHNIYIHEYGHSGVFLSPAYSAYFWLPFFWGIEPPEYRDFAKLCWAAAEKEREKRRTEVREIENELGNIKWRWAGCTLRDYIRKQIVDRRGTPEGALLDWAITLTWENFDNATDAFHNRAEGWAERVQMLNPILAVTKAVDALPL